MLPSDFRAGVRAAGPLLVGIIPFALVAGVAAVGAGLSVVQALGMSVVVFAGASQLAAIELIGRSAPVTVVVVTAVIINLRMMMYSASIAPYFREYRTRWQALMAYVLTDQAFALSLTKYQNDESVDQRWFYLGVALTLWVVWQVGTVTGALLGTGIPASWGLEFAVPLVFLALLVPAMEDRETVAAGLVGGTVAVLGAGLPLNLGLPLGTALGVGTGMLLESGGTGATAGAGAGDADDTEVDA